MSAVQKVLAGVLTAGLLAAAMWLYTFKPHIEDRMQDPITSSGRIGAVVANRVFSVKVGRVDVAKAITKPSFPNPETMPSPGLFVIVQTQIKSNRKPFQPGHVKLLTKGGVTYDETGRVDIFTNNDDYQPMLWAPATYVFEIPTDRLAGVRLIIGEAGVLNQLSAESDVDLGMDRATAARLSTHPFPTYTLKTS